MSLTERSSGILETHVTWNDIEEEMQKALGTTATFGEKRSAKNIGEGNGFMSRMCLIEPNWQNAVETETLPPTFIVKICSQLTLVEFCDKMKDVSAIGESDLTGVLGKHAKELHNVEVDVYGLLNKYAEGKIPLAKIYATKKFTESENAKGYLIMEHLNDLQSVHLVDDVDVEAVRQVLRSVAVLEAVGLKLSDDEKALLPRDIFTRFFQPIFTEEWLKTSLDACRALRNEELEKRMPALETIMNEIIDPRNFERIDNLSNILGMTPVFCHSDLWSTNILWGGKQGSLQLRAVIDFQTAHMGSAAADLGRLICATMGADDRREHCDQLLEDFYGYLREEVEGEMPYSLEQLKESYQLFFPFASLVIFPTIIPLLDYLKKRGDNNNDCDERVMKKTLGLIDDCISVQRRNNDRYARL